MEIIKVRNLNYNTSNKSLFKDITLDIESGTFTSIVGENSVGKTMLMKLLSGSIITDNFIKIDNIQVNKFCVEDIMKRTATIYSYNEFFSKTVMNEILQDKKNVDIYDVNLVRKLLDNFNLINIENISPLKLSYAENQIVALIKAIIKKPKIIFLDNAFSRLDVDKRHELLNYLKKYCKQNDITIILSSNDINDLKYSDRIIYLKNQRIEFDGDYSSFIKLDLNKEGFKLPWALEVSNKLIMYGLIDKETENMDELVGELLK